MAIVKFGPTVVGLRGTVGGLTFTAGKAGPYCRAFALGAQPRVTKQQTQRAYLSNQAAAWRALTGAQQTTWVTYAALPAQALINSLGETYYASGFAWFVKCNVRLKRMALAAVVNAPIVARPAAPTLTSLLFSITGAPSAGKVTWPLNTFLNYNQVTEMQIYNSVGRRVAVSGYKEIRLLLVPDPLSNNYQDQWQAVFGTVQLGQKGFIRMYRQTAEGDRSAAGAVSAIATNT